MVVRDNTDDRMVHKLIKKNTSCSEAKAEFSRHQKIYDMYVAFISDHPGLKKKVAVPKPHLFINDHNPKSPYVCSYSMERVVSRRRDGLAEHVMLNPNYTFVGGKIMFVRGNSVPLNTYVSGDVKKAQQPRGAFLHIKQLQNRGYDVNDLAFRMGVLVQLIIVAGQKPKDVEFVLGCAPRQFSTASNANQFKTTPCLWVMDFGMTHENAYDEEMEPTIPEVGDERRVYFDMGKRCVAAWLKQSKNLDGNR